MGNSKEGTVWEASAGKLASASTKFWNGLGSRGAEIITRLDDEKDPLRKRVQDFILRGGITDSAHQKLVRYIMGQNFWGLEEWAQNHGGIFTKKQEQQVAEFPWGEDVLTSACSIPRCGKIVKDCHFAFLGLDRLNKEAVNILKLQGRYPASGQPKFYSYAPSAWYSTHDFATLTTLGFRWYLMHQEIVLKSTSTDYQNQLTMLPAEYEVPLCIEETTKDLFMIQKTGRYPNRSVYARCRDLSANGNRLYAGYCDGNGVSLNVWDDYSDGLIGLAASRKLPA